jgi:hypothetical protein
VTYYDWNGLPAYQKTPADRPRVIDRNGKRPVSIDEMEHFPLEATPVPKQHFEKLLESLTK